MPDERDETRGVGSVGAVGIATSRLASCGEATIGDDRPLLGLVVLTLAEHRVVAPRYSVEVAGGSVNMAHRHPLL